jgi:hypothetical protein
MGSKKSCPKVVEGWPTGTWHRILGPSATVTADACRQLEGTQHPDRLWKVELARLAEETGLTITVCHYPPGTSKWNKIEHRMFSFITMNWRGRPLTCLRTSRRAHRRHRHRHRAQHPVGVRPQLVRRRRQDHDHELAALPSAPHDFHGTWNYTIDAQSDAT